MVVFKLFLVMLIFPLLNLLSVTMSEENLKKTDDLQVREVFPIADNENMNAYCEDLKSSNQKNLRTTPRPARATVQYRNFSIKELADFTEEHWRGMLREKFEYKCSPLAYVPRRTGNMKNYPEMSCHQLCRACFKDSLPVCLKRNIGNDFGLTCYCSFDAVSPVHNHDFKIYDI